MAKGICSVEDCPKPHMARGWCGTHYQNWRRCGDPLGLQLVRPTDCAFDGCDNPNDSRGYCQSHAGQLRRGEGLRPLRSYGGGTCSEPDCDKPLVALGLCKKHWQRNKTHGDPSRVDRGREGSRKYTLNESFFDEITTEAQAYWLGFITADGGIIESGRTHALRVDLSDRDAKHLERMRGDLGSSKPISFRRTFACASFDSWRLVESLARLGITPRKSATVRPWDGPANLMRHYWRGMVDGDGSIFQTSRDGIWHVNLVGSEACVRAFSAWAGEICGSRAVPHHAKGGCWTWTVEGGPKPQMLTGALYGGDVSIALERKRERAEELLAVDFAERRIASEARRAAAIRDSWASGRHARAKRA